MSIRYFLSAVGAGACALIYLKSSVCALFACLGLGVGGNLPVDGALFLEFLPFASGNLLTMLSVWWPVGQLIARLVPIEPFELCEFKSSNNSLVLLHGASSPVIAAPMTCPPAKQSVTESPAAERTTTWAGDTSCSLWAP